MVQVEVVVKVVVDQIRSAWRAAKEDFALEWMGQSPIWRDGGTDFDVLGWRKGFFLSFCAKYGMVPIFENEHFASTPSIKYVEVNDERLFAWFLLIWS